MCAHSALHWLQQGNDCCVPAVRECGLKLVLGLCSSGSGTVSRFIEVFQDLSSSSELLRGQVSGQVV